MRTKFIAALSLLLAVTFLTPTGAEASRVKRGLTGFEAGSPNVKAQAAQSKSKLKPFKSLIKDHMKVEGVFTFYVDTATNKVLMAITPEQMDKVYLCGESVYKSSGVFSDNGRMYRTYPFYLTRQGGNIQFMEKNLRLRADDGSSLARAVASGITDPLLGSTPVMSKPDKDSKAVLVDATALLVVDATNLSYYAGKIAKTGFSFDKKNSYIERVQSFPHNSEIDVRLHYHSSKPLSRATLQNPYSVYHTHRYSFTELPESDYQPRLADERMGHFMTVFQDYSSPANSTPYVRYVERWNLKKKFPDSAMSEPVKPIVYWVQNTVPEEYREAVAAGIEFWQKSFEKIGFRNAIIAKQMPDTADWEPADIRYSTVQWIVPGHGPAVGPSRANPFTGEIFDADVRIPADFIRHMFNVAERWVSPLSFDGMEVPSDDPLESIEDWMQSDGSTDSRMCNYAQESYGNAAWGYSVISSMTGDFAGKDSLSQEYIRQYLTQLVAHEVGHTLGFRHNFKASAIYSLDRLGDKDFTASHGNIGTVMEYPSVYVAGSDGEQGDFYSTVPGPHDDWVIEYAYSDFGDLSMEDELPRLEEIASKAGDARLAYGTDEDAFGYSIKSPDPYCNLFDIGDDPLAFCEHQIDLTKDLWNNGIKQFEKPGARYQEIYNSFLRGWISYSQLARIATKYIGGLERTRSRIGDPNTGLPFKPISAAEQRRAMEMLKTHLFAEDAFSFSPDLVNKLQYETYPDFFFSVYRVPQTDYPLHQRALRAQQIALSRLYSPQLIGRLLNNQLRVGNGTESYTMADMFTNVRRAIWTEVTGPREVNSFRRQLQMAHLFWVLNVYLSRTSLYPSDARTLAANDLDILEAAARKAAGASGLDNMSRAHYKEVIRQITAAKEARRSYIGG